MNEFSKLISDKRTNFGFTQAQFAQLLGLKENGERTIRSWESGKHLPSLKKQADILKIKIKIPFKLTKKHSGLRTLDLFAGIGGMRLGFQKFGCRCVFSSEIDPYAQKTYLANFGTKPFGDIYKLKDKDIPDHDILLAGFPCQAFSNAGLKKGFEDDRGILFFEIQRILNIKRPKMFLLENVKQLRSHNNGRTLDTIMECLTGIKNELPLNLPENEIIKQALKNKLNYWCDFKIISSKDYKVPQNRQRIYLVGFNREYYKDVNFNELFNWPKNQKSNKKLSSILQSHNEVDPKYTLSEKLMNGHIKRKERNRKKGNGFGYSLFKKDAKQTNTLSARYYKDGSEILIDQSDLGLRPRKLTPRECARLQGFPEKFIIDMVPEVQAYRQFGNSVSVPVIEAIAKKMIDFDKNFK